MKTDHILIIRFSAIGDVAMTVPVIYALARQYPRLRVTVLSQPFARRFYDQLLPNVGFMEADVKREYRGVTGLNALYRRLVAKNFTAVADFHDVLRSKYLRTRFNLDRYHVQHINKHRSMKKQLTSYYNKVMRQLPPVFDCYAEVLEKLGYPVDLNSDEGFRSLFPPGGGNLRLLPPSIGDKKGFQQWIGIAPFAAHAQKVYPMPLMQKVVKELVKRHPSCRVFIFGSKKESDKIREIADAIPQCLSVPDVMEGFENELILMSHLDVMVSMDSANMHLASLTDTPVVSVWGATHPWAGFMGWRQNPDNAVQIDLPCRPCSIYGNRRCLRGDLACMSRIPPQMIVDRVEIVLKRNGA